jgi:TolB protein
LDVRSILPPNPSPTAEASIQPSLPPSIGLVAYSLPGEVQVGQGSCTGPLVKRPCQISRIWIAKADGTDAHLLLPDYDLTQRAIEWSPDGSQLLFEGEDVFMLTDQLGSEPHPLPIEAICGDRCTGYEGWDFSPDGTRLAFVRWGSTDGVESSVISILDLSTGLVTELTSTYVTRPDVAPCQSSECHGINDAPRWSPDGTRLAFGRQGIGPSDDRGLNAVLFVVNADGTDLRQVSPDALNALGPQWSPDGQVIAFIDSLIQSTLEVSDVYTVRADGSDVRRLTTDGRSVLPVWTSEGRVVFARETGPVDAFGFEFWITDADGNNQARLGETLAELNAAGCVRCPYFPKPFYTEPQGWLDALWQPLP